VRVLQWDRYCLENYLINRKLLFDELTDLRVLDLGSRGSFEQRVIELALGQLNAVIATEVYKNLEPDNPGMRSSEIERKSFSEMADILAARLQSIKSGLSAFDSATWKIDFISKCSALHGQREGQWKEEWLKLCSGKRLIDDIYREFTLRGVSKFDFKRGLARRMKAEQTEDWTLVKSKIRDALGV
jgi:hypothetical protein